MPTANLGDNIDFSNSKFRKLSKQGDKVLFRLLSDKYFYDGKHFLEDSSEQSGWRVVPCPRINEGAECEICENFFAAHKSAKKEGLNRSETDKLTRPFQPVVSFYLPILNRETESFEIFQTTQGVRKKIEAQKDLGTKVMERDLIVVRTENPGSDYYSLTVVDSSETKKLSEKEKAEVKKGSAANLEEFVNGRESDEDEVEYDIEI